MNEKNKYKDYFNNLFYDIYSIKKNQERNKNFFWKLFLNYLFKLIYFFIQLKIYFNNYEQNFFNIYFIISIYFYLNIPELHLY